MVRLHISKEKISKLQHVQLSPTGASGLYTWTLTASSEKAMKVSCVKESHPKGHDEHLKIIENLCNIAGVLVGSS